MPLYAIRDKKTSELESKEGVPGTVAVWDNLDDVLFEFKCWHDSSYSEIVMLQVRPSVLSKIYINYGGCPDGSF